MRETKKIEKKLNSYQQTLVVDNIGLAYSRAMIMKNTYSNYKITLDMDDFKSYALEGLCNAALKYDLSRNVKFSTFAVSYIDNYIKSNVYAENPTIKVPAYSLDEEKRKKYRFDALNNSMIISNISGCSDSEGDVLTLDQLYYCGEQEINFQNIEDTMYIESIKEILTPDEREFLSLLLDGGHSLIDISNKLDVHLNTVSRRKKKLARKIKDYMSVL